MKSFLVQWEITIDADTPRGAALKAREIQRDPGSIASCFTVTAARGVLNAEVPVMVDLDYDPDYPVAHFREPISSKAGAESFLRRLHEEGRLFHLDDDPTTIVNIRVGTRTFTDEEARLLKARVNELFLNLGDPFVYCVELMGEDDPE